MTNAGFGSVVITKDQKIFISIGLGKITLEKETFFAISIMVPLSKALMAKQKNDVIELNGKKIEIKEVF
jgi:transcription elongation GreA/GreB family factor